jgi:hypothetical protein
MQEEVVKDLDYHVSKLNESVLGLIVSIYCLTNADAPRLNSDEGVNTEVAMMYALASQSVLKNGFP